MDIFTDTFFAGSFVTRRSRVTFDLYQPVVCSTHVVLFLLVPESMFYWHWSGAHIIFCVLYGSVYALVWVADTCVLGCSDFHFFHIYGNVSPSLFSLGPKSSENV